MKYKIEEYLDRIDEKYELFQIGISERSFDSFSHVDHAKEQSIIWISLSKSEEFRKNILKTTKASIVIIDIKDPLYHEINDQNILLIRAESPRKLFAQLMRLVIPSITPVGIHPTAIIASSAQIDPTAYIGPYCIVEHHGIVGAQSVLKSHVIIKEHSKVGSRVKIDSNSVIGSEGFGYIKESEESSWEHFPHIGGVCIGNDVDIGASVCIDRGTLGDTIIGNGVKIDNLVHIAHNVKIDDHVTVIAQSMIGGSVYIGTHTWISPSVTIRDGLSIGQNVLIGIGSVVTKSIPDGQVYLGNPAREQSQYYSRYNLKNNQ